MRELVGHQGVGESLPHAAVRRWKLTLLPCHARIPRPPPSPVKVAGPIRGPKNRHAVQSPVRQLGLSHRSQPAAPPYKQLLRVPFFQVVFWTRCVYLIGCNGFCAFGTIVTAIVFVQEGGM